MQSCRYYFRPSPLLGLVPGCAPLASNRCPTAGSGARDALEYRAGAAA